MLHEHMATTSVETENGRVYRTATGIPGPVSMTTVSCPITGRPLFTVLEDKPTQNYASYGLCIGCGAYYHESALHLNCTPSIWTVIYEGVWCNSCWNMDVAPGEKRPF